MRIIFMGTPSYASVILEKLLHVKTFDIVGLFTQMDKPVGRKKILTPPHIKDFILKNYPQVRIFQPKNLKQEGVVDDIKSLKPDFIVVAAYGQILPKSVLEICPCINLHASILPKYRGASPIQSAILNNEKYSGVTAMKMNEGLDTGDILGFSYIKLSQTSEILFEELSQLAKNLTIKILQNYEKIEPLKQIDALSSYSPKIIKQDGLVDIYSDTADEIYRKFLAFNPWPGIFLKDGLKLVEFTCKEFTCKDEICVIKDIQKEQITLTCKNGVLEISQVQPPSKQKMSAYDYIMGLRKKVGDKLY